MGMNLTATHRCHFLITREIQFIFETTLYIAFPPFESTTLPMTCAENSTQSIPKLIPLLWFRLQKQRLVLIHSGMRPSLACFTLIFSMLEMTCEIFDSGKWNSSGSG